MKRIVTVLAVLCLSASFAAADYVDPPNWGDNPYYTHQSWEFDTESLSPDVVDNPYGDPLMVINGGVYSNGGWMFNGPITADQMNPQLGIYIPNTPNPELLKEIWLQVTLNTNDWGLADSLQLWAMANNGTPYPPNLEELDINVVDETTGRIRLTVPIDIFPQPANEWIYLTASMDEGSFIFLDEIDVDTRCVPEPSAIVLLVCSAIMGIMAYRRG